MGIRESVMLWFKRSKEPPAPARTASTPSTRPQRPERSAAAARAAARAAAPPPLPEVVAEGNTQADWSMWEDSVSLLDSQMQDLGPASRFQVRDTGPAPVDERDPFAGVKRHRDL